MQTSLRSPTRLRRLVSRTRLADVVLTALILNMVSAVIRGGTEIAAFGVTLRTPSRLLSAALLAGWLGGRFLLRRGTSLTLRAAGAGLKNYQPEVLVAVLFAVGLAMRLTGIGFGAPLVLHPDEPVLVGPAIAMLKTGSLAPPVPYHYPTVFSYLLLPAFGLRYVRGKSAGLWSDLGDVNRLTFEFYELARAHSAVLGALTIVLVYIAARKMWPGSRGRWVGGLAATFVTFSFNHVKESHHGVTDAALTFFIVVAFIAILSALRKGTSGAFALAGFACGIACATKYSALPIVAVLMAAHFADWRTAWRRWQRLLIGLAAVPVGFFTGYPYALLNWPPFLEHLGWMSGFSARAFSPDGRSARIVGYSMESGLGLLFTIVLGLSIVRAVHRRKAEDLLAVTFIVVAMSLLSNTAFPFYPRYLLPILPFAALLVGATVLDSAEWLFRSRRNRMLVPACSAALMALLVWSQALEAFAFVKYVSSPDTRVQAYEFLLANVPPGSTVVSEERYLRLPGRDYRFLRWLPLQSREPAEFAKEKVAAVVFSSDRDVRPNHEAAQARRELRKLLPLAAVFSAGDGVHVGPTVSIHLGRAE